MLLDAIPTIFLCTIFVFLFVLVAEIGLLVFNLWYNRQNLPKSNEVAGLIFGAISLIYSLILAFVIVAVWTNYDNLNQTVEREADLLNSILVHSATLPDSLKLPLNNAVYSYCNQVINEEWKMKGTEDVLIPSAIPPLRMMLLRLQPQNKMQESIYSVIDNDLSGIDDLRRARLDHTQAHVPDLVWLILNTGSVIVIVFSYFLNAPSEKLKRIYLFFIGSIIAMSLFLVYVLDHPFNGSAQISKKPYESILFELKQNNFERVLNNQSR